MSFLHNGDISYYYEMSNNFPEKPITVFLHEALGSVAQWKDFYKIFCSKLELDYLVFDREGYGKSTAFKSKPKLNYLHQSTQNEISLIIKKLIPKRKIILFGHSDGGSIALLYSALNANNVEAVITEAAHVFVENETLYGVKKATEAYKKGNLDALQKYHGNKTDDVFYAWSNTWLCNDFKEWNICADITGLSTLILAIQGADDEYGTGEQLNKIKKATGKNTSVQTIENCGHAPHFSQTEKVINLSSKFLFGHGVI